MEMEEGFFAPRRVTAKGEGKSEGRSEGRSKGRSKGEAKARESIDIFLEAKHAGGHGMPCLYEVKNEIKGKGEVEGNAQRQSQRRGRWKKWRRGGNVTRIVRLLWNIFGGWRNSMIKRWVVMAMVCVGLFAMGLIPARVSALDNGVARTPPMGWNSWNKFGCNVSEGLIKSMADAMVTSGMKQAGYQYVVIDDCWQVSRDEQGNIVADPRRFPGGIKALADYVHGKGLKFGIYSDAGPMTCAEHPGSRGHEFQDARQYATWAWTI
jgi:hypothetical protein